MNQEWPKRELHSLETRRKLARQIFIERYQALLNDPGYQPVQQEERDNLEALKRCEKIVPSRMDLDRAARVCQEKGVSAFVLKDVAAIYDELFVDWRQSGFVDYDPSEWEDV